MWQQLQRASLFIRLVAYVVKALFTHHLRSLRLKVYSLTSRSAPADDGGGEQRTRNIVIVGAAFAGYHAARVIATSLPRRSPYRVVVVEPNSHFNFTWVLPRFCVVEGHEHKAFIPYGGYVSGPGVAPGAVRWVRNHVESAGRTSVRLRGGEEIQYDFLIVATGANVAEGLPSRLGVEDKADGVELLRAYQQRIKAAKHVVVAGGGAAGVEVATDAKAAYPEKDVVLVHSRSAVMHRFSPGLQAATVEALERLGVKLVLEEKVVSHDVEANTVSLTSGTTIECDCFVNCTGQKPASGLIAALSPTSVSSSGHISVKPTLQITDDSLPNVYACGDVAETHTPNPNSRSAMRQAEIVADNVLIAIHGKEPRYTYKPQWGDGLIKLTLGLDRSVLQFWDGKSEMLFPSEEKDLALMVDSVWTKMGAKPFDDTGEMKG